MTVHPDAKSTTPPDSPFDPRDMQFLQDPYARFAQLRSAGELIWHEGLNLWLAVSHAACETILRDRSLGRIWRDKEPLEKFAAFNLLHQNSLLEREPPEHTRLRRLIAGAFGRAHVQRLEPWIAQRSTELVTEAYARNLDSGAPVDFLATVAEQLPVEVIAELLCVPEADRHLLRPWSNDIVKMYEYGLDAEGQATAEAAAAEFVAYLRDLIQQRRAAPIDGDLLTDLIRASEEGETLSEDEIVGTAALLLMAGHEATVNVLGNGLTALLTPGAARGHDAAGKGSGRAWDELVADPATLPTGIEEMIRYDSALQLFERTATQDVELRGVSIQAGQKVGAALGAAHRDPKVFAEPDHFDVRRSPNNHLGFGVGLHYCVGAPLARLEIAGVLQALLECHPEQLQLGEGAQRRREYVIRGWHEVPVVWA